MASGSNHLIAAYYSFIDPERMNLLYQLMKNKDYHYTVIQCSYLSRDHSARSDSTQLNSTGS